MIAATLLIAIAATPAPQPERPEQPMRSEARPAEWGPCVERVSWRRDDWSDERPGAQRLGDLPPAELMRAVLREVEACQGGEPAPPAEPQPPAPSPEREPR